MNEATPPFRIVGINVYDSTDALVLACSREGDCTARYSEIAIDADPSFICPRCGRLGLRMEEASPKQCGL